MSGSESDTTKNVIAFTIDARRCKLTCNQPLQKDPKPSCWFGRRQVYVTTQDNDPTMIIRGIMSQVRAHGESLGLYYINVDTHELTLKFESGVTDTSERAEAILKFAVEYAAVGLKQRVAVAFV